MKSLYVVAMAALVATSALADTAKAPPKPDIAKGSTVSANTCAACHANDGTRGVPTYPILQGQHADYLVKQLDEFKSGKRDNPIMKGMAGLGGSEQPQRARAAAAAAPLLAEAAGYGVVSRQSDGSAAYFSTDDQGSAQAP